LRQIGNQFPKFVNQFLGFANPEPGPGASGNGFGIQSPDKGRIVSGRKDGAPILGIESNQTWGRFGR
jgi:hypothetical protein